MKVESKLTFWINFQTIIISFFSSILLAILVFIFLAMIFSHEGISIKDIMGLIFLSSIFLNLFLASIILRKKIIVDLGHLKILYFFGLLSWSYRYSTLKISDHFTGNDGILIQLENGEQITLGEKQYKNYYHLKDLLLANIKDNRKLEVKFTNRLTLIMISLMITSLVLFIISNGYSNWSLNFK